MKIVKTIWTIKELIEKKDSIDPRPQYQRTPVWNQDRKAFLIDSILRGYDIPKIYLKYEENKDAFEVVDGQQRMRALWGFATDEYPLNKKTLIDGVDVSSLSYSELSESMKTTFQNYEINISEILASDRGEVNDLFTRLQKGVSLNPPELRHALISKIGEYISDFVEKQKLGFFSKDCKIEDKRFKHQDYIDHCIALIHYKNSKDLKAATLIQLYLDFLDASYNDFSEYFRETALVLKFMNDINSGYKGIFKNKWGFVDGYWLLYRNISKISTINKSLFRERLIEFEIERKKFNNNPEALLDPKNSSTFGKSMFDYIQAFNKEGANKKNIEIRATVYDSIFKDVIN